MPVSIMNNCILCPRNCGVNRAQGSKGFCGESDAVRVARAALHYWEEPMICGTKGSGAVFFTGCNLKCIFCQNASIAANEIGKEITVDRLADIFLELQEQGAVNINLVTASHYVPQVALALRQAKNKGLQMPVVYNTSAYEKVESLMLLDGLVDIYLPDMKYADAVMAKRYSNAENYPEVAKAAIAEMFRQVGRTVINEQTGLLQRGMIVRHLVMPEGVKNAKAVLEYLYQQYGDDIYISIMNQYTPLRQFTNYPALNRKVTKREYDRVINHAMEIGICNAFIQEGETAEESFIPAFDYEGVDAKNEQNM